MSSGITLTYAHRCILASDFSKAFYALVFTIFYGLVFTFCQFYEYVTCPFSINDSVYGSIFFLSTGFHGLHVIVGTFLLSVALFRLRNGHFSSVRHLGFECAAYY